MMGADRMPLEALLLLFTLLSSVLFVQAALDIQNKKLILRRVDMCKGTEKLPIRWTNFSIVYTDEKKDAMLGLKVTVLTEVSNNFTMKFNFWKCDASGNPDSCEYVLKDSVNKEICKYMVMKNQAWTVFMDHFDKPLSCPIKPGVYNVVNCPIKADFLRFFPISDAVWKVNLRGFDGQKPLSCVQIEIQIVPFLGGRRRIGK